MNGDGAFNSQIMVDKLAKLNNSKQSIETLSYWCMFHRKSAKQVVETWNRQFFCSPKDQKVSFLYLANDILQNSRKKGLEFIDEFAKVLPNALNDVIDNGDESGRKAVLRLVDIWEDRKVFTVHGKSLKEDFLGKNSDEKVLEYNLNQPSGDALEKLVLSFCQIYDGCNEDLLFDKCNALFKSAEEVKKEIERDLGNGSQSKFANKLQLLHDELKDCVDRLKAAESARVNIQCVLREVLDEQETKCKELQNLLQVAQGRHEQAKKILSKPTIQSEPSQNGVVAPPVLSLEQNQENVPQPPILQYSNAMQPSESFNVPQMPLQMLPFPQPGSVQPLPLPFPPLPLMAFPSFMGPLDGFTTQGFDASAASNSGFVPSVGSSEPPAVPSDSAK